MNILLRIAPCFFAIIIDSLGFGLVYPVMASLFTQANSPLLAGHDSVALRHFCLGLGYLLYPLFMFFGASFLADLSDAWGRKKVLLLCMFGIALSFLAMALGVVFGSLVLLFVGRALSGLMAGSQPIAQASIVDLSDASNKAKNMGLISLSYAVGLAFGPFVGGVLSDHRVVSWFNYATPFYFAMALSLAAFVWVWISFAESGQLNANHHVSWLRPLQIFRDAFEHKAVRWLSLVYLTMQLGWSTYFQYLIVYMQHAHHYRSLEMGLLQGMFGIGSAIGLLVLIPWMSRRLSSAMMARWMFACTGIGVLVSAMAPWAWLQWPLAIYVSAVNAAAFAAILTVFSDAVDESRQGWVMGVSSAVMAFTWVLTGLASNLITWLGVQGLMVLGGVMLCVATVLLRSHREVS